MFSQEAFIDSLNVKDPSVAWKLGFIPSAGQLYNEDYLKVGAFWLMEGYAYYKFDEYRKEDKLAKRNTYAWWVVGLYVMSILEAYVDAHLSTFPVVEEKLEEEKEEKE